MKITYNIFLLCIWLFSIVHIACSDMVMNNHDEQKIILNGKRFKDLFIHDDVELIMQDARWKEYAVYARCNRNRCTKFPSVVMTQSQINQEYKKFQDSCYYFDEKTRCWIVMHVTKFYTNKSELPFDHHWEDDFEGIEKAITRYLPS